MPSASFFVHLGFFVRPGFLDVEGCEHLIAEASAAPNEPCRLVRNGVDDVLDERTRCADSALVSKATRIRMKQRFLEVTPEIEAHFGMPLAGSETPGFLIYNTGAFFTAHADSGPTIPSEIRRRRISAILFLNSPSREPSEDGYGGGALRFHRLLDGQHWEGCPLSFEPEAGMLVAFRSDIVHEVLPVTFGRRFTIVTWFPGKDE